jgi:competence transcription factor ComK
MRVAVGIHKVQHSPPILIYPHSELVLFSEQHGACDRDL